MKEELDRRRLPCGVAIENLSKRPNLGNVIRAANAFLCGEIVLIGSQRFEYMGSGKLYRFERMKHFPEKQNFLNYVRQQGYTLVAVEIDPRAEILHRFNFPEKPMFLFGAELPGLSEELMEAADRHLMVPQFGLVGSLNVSMTCTLVLYQYLTTRFPDLEPASIEGSKFKFRSDSGRE